MAAESRPHENRGLPRDDDAGRHDALPSHLREWRDMRIDLMFMRSEFETLAAALMSMELERSEPSKRQGDKLPP